MNITQNVLIGLALALLSVPALGAQDLSKYRSFSLGSSLAVVSKQADIALDQVRTSRQTPALIQQVSLWPMASSDAPAGSEDVQQMQLSFCNGDLYNITVIYRTAATEGLTSEDMIRAMSANYGLATQSASAGTPAAPFSFDNADAQLASWQDSKYSVVLSRSMLSQSFQLVVLSKALQAQADTAIAEAIAQDREDAPRRESARVQKAAEDMQSLRETNLKAFRP
jgi:hypothetical protein